jgi:hypothetical protein
MWSSLSFSPACNLGTDHYKSDGGGGDFLRGNIYIFGTPIEEIFFSHLMTGNIFFK